MSDVGRNTILTEELFKQIKQCVLNGKDLKTTASICGINEGTFYVWHSDNYLSLADKIEGWKRDRKVILASNNIEQILQIPITEKDVLKVVADISKFTLETLDKENYAKRQETTGKDGEALIPIQINSTVAENNGITSSTNTNSQRS